MNEIQRLIELYLNKSKHSNYQEIPSALKPYFGGVNLSPVPRFEKARLEFIKRYINSNNVSMLDVGANTGFFSFELLEDCVERVTIYEGNKSHSEFIKAASKFLKLDKRIEVNNSYFDTENPPLDAKFDLTLLLNVLHHIGDDYGNVDGIDEAKLKISQSLCNLSKITKKVIFQLGYNWKGDKHLSLFRHGTKTEQIDFVSRAIEGFWTVDAIGLATNNNGIVSYDSPNAANLQRQDALGEFLNRPLFILSSVNLG